MNNQNGENTEELFGKFFGSQDAKEAAEQLAKTEKMLRDNRAPEPDGELVAKIKVQIAESLHRRKQNSFRHLAYRVAAVAAVVIIAITISIKLFEKSGIEPGPNIPAAVWENDDLTEDDTDLAVFAAEIEQIESELFALKYNEETSNGSEKLVELEMEVVEIDNDFWKG